MLVSSLFPKLKKDYGSPSLKKTCTFESRKFEYKILHLFLLFFIIIRNTFEKPKKYRSRFLEGKDENIEVKYKDAKK